MRSTEEKHKIIRQKGEKTWNTGSRSLNQREWPPDTATGTPVPSRGHCTSHTEIQYNQESGASTFVLCCVVWSCLVWSGLVLSCLVLPCDYLVSSFMLSLTRATLRYSTVTSRVTLYRRVARLCCLMVSCVVLSCLVLCGVIWSSLVTFCCVAVSRLVSSCLVSCRVLSGLVWSGLSLSCLVLSCPSVIRTYHHFAYTKAFLSTVTDWPWALHLNELSTRAVTRVHPKIGSVAPWPQKCIFELGQRWVYIRAAHLTEVAQPQASRYAWPPYANGSVHTTYFTDRWPLL